MRTPEELKEKYTERVLRDMNECDSTCEPLGMKSSTKYEGNITDWLLANLPSIQYALDRKMNYLFSNGLTTGDERYDEKLNDWLYGQTNRYGATNYSVLREATRMAGVYGESGIRWFDGNIYAYKQGHFGLLVSSEEGIEKIEAY